MLTVAGCGGHHRVAGVPPPVSTTTTTEAPPRLVPANLDTSASLNLGLAKAPTNWNPLSAAGAGDATALVAAAVLPSVFRMQGDGRLGLDTEFAASAMETRRSPQTVVYRLNPKATWSDGVPITATDFAYTWRAQSGQPSLRDVGGALFSPASTLGYSRIASVAATDGDPDTVTVVFSAPYAGWQRLFSPILPAHIAQNVGFDHGFTNPVDDDVSGGPFLVQSDVPGRSFTLVRNARYWGSPASLSSVTVDFVGSSVVAGALSEGQLGAALFAVGDLPTSGGVLGDLRAATGLKVDEAPSSVWEDLEFSPMSTALDDAAVREAIILAVDRSSLIASAVGAVPGVVPLGNRFFLPQAPGYVDNTANGYVHADPAGAVAILDRAGYRRDADGQLVKGATPVVLNLIVGVNDGLHRAEEATLVGELGAVGIVVHATTVADLNQRVAANDYDLALVERQGGASPEAVGLPAMVTSPGSGTDRQVAELVRQGAAAATVQVQDAIYNKIDSLLWFNAVDLPLFQIPSVLAYQDRFTNLTNVSFAAGLGYNIAQWGVPDRS